ncbi:hypothetical protein SLS62_009035 [Diatrype stigma]|uniref:Phosphoglycerate mutase n=1 Tax=Diatrype stigma TaxID=117547 RepID=A0AAN9UG23_9PEZI
MPPTIILIRHAQAEHNATQNWDIHDPDLSELGQNQCLELRKSLMENPLAQQAGLIVVSPMRRTVQTALRSLDWLIEKGVKIEADANWQANPQNPENSDKPCDTGTPAAQLAQEFPAVDFATALDPVYPDKRSAAAAAYHFQRSAILARAQTALRRLRARPEKVIVVVSHSGFLRVAVTGCFYFNADYRVFDFAAPPPQQKSQTQAALVAGSGGDIDVDGKGGANAETEKNPQIIEVVQHALTKEKGGGLGWSWTEHVELGTGLPDELPSAAA